MVELGGMLAAAILKVVGDQIGSAIGGQIKLHKDFTKDLKKMKMALETVEAVMEDAERLSVTDKLTRLWLKRLKDAMYAISDMIDEFESDSEAITKPSARKVCVVPITIRSLASTYLQEAKKQMKNCSPYLMSLHQNTQELACPKTTCNIKDYVNH
jgi:hypothetical protein